MRAFLPLACVLVLIGCDHKERTETNPAADAWTELASRMDAQLQTLRERQQALATRVSALVVPAGTEDVTLSTTIAELQGGLVPAGDAVGKVELAIRQGTADVEAALASRNKVAAERAVEAARAAFDAAVGVADPPLSLLEPKLAAAEQIVQRLGAGIEAELAQLRRLASGGGSLDFQAIEFREGTAEFDFARPGGKATLDRIVQFAAACPQLRFTITGHTSKEGVAARNKALSLERADAVRRYLIENGVEPAKIVGTAGLGSTKTMVEEPDPGTAAETSMDAGTLEMLRRRNRRITIAVATSCAVAAAPTEPAQAPPTAPTAVVRPVEAGR